MDDERKIVLYYIARKLHLERMIICLMHVVMAYILVHRHYDIDINDETESQPTDIRDDEDNSPMSVGQNSYSQQVNHTQSNRKKRSRLSDEIAAGLDDIVESLRQMMEKVDQQMLVLADSIRPKIDSDMQQFLHAELKRLGFSISIRVKAFNKFSEKPHMFDVFKELDEDEEKLEFISELIRGSSHG